MPPSEAQKRATKAYRQKQTKQIVLDYKTEEYETISTYCERKGIAKATFIRTAIKEKMEREPIEEQSPGATQ